MLRRHVLIFHQAALGDFIVTWPIALALGRMFAQSRISYVTASSKGALAGRVIGVETIDIERDWHLLHAPAADLPQANQKTLEGAQLIVSFVSDAGDIWEQNIARYAPEAALIRLRTKPVEDAPAVDPELPQVLQNHISAVLVAQLATSPMVQAGVRQMLRSVVTRGLPVGRSHDGPIIIHPGAGKIEKCWPIERFVKLAEMLKRKKLAVRVLLGEAELEKWPAQVIRTISDVADVRTPATLIELLNEIASGSTFIGNDSGPSHLAGIIGLNTIALFGTPSDRWKPLGPHVHVVQGETIDSISVDAVASVIHANINAA